MKRIENAPIEIAVLDASGGSFSIAVRDIKRDITVSSLLSDESSFGIVVKDENLSSVSALLSDNSSFSVLTSVVEKELLNPPAAATPQTVTPVAVASTTVISGNFSFKRSAEVFSFQWQYRDLPIADVSYSGHYYSGYKAVDNVYKSLAYNEGYVFSESDTLKNFRFTQGSDTLVRNIIFPFSLTMSYRVTAELPVTYNIYTRFQKEFTIGYRSDFPVSRAIELSYYNTSRVSQSLDISYAVMTEAKKAVPVSYTMLARVMATVDASYGIYSGVSKSLPLSYVTLGGVKSTVPVSYTMLARTASSNDVSYGIFNRVVKTIDVNYVVRTKASKEASTSYTMFARVVSTASVSYILRTKIQKALPVSYYNVSRVNAAKNISYNNAARLNTFVEVGYEIHDYNRLYKEMNLSYFTVASIITVSIPPDSVHTTLPDGTVISSGATLTHGDNVDIIEVEPLLIIDGQQIYVTEISITIDEGNYTYTLQAKLANYADLVKFEANKTFYAVLQGEVYVFVVDSRSIDRNEINAPATTVRGLSPTSKFTGPRSKQILGTTFTDALSARQISEQLLYDPKINYTIGASDGVLDQGQAAAIGLHWEIDDWGIPPFRYGAENVYPLDAVKTIVEAVGGVVEAYPDGDIRVRYKHPVRVPDYSDATISHSFLDANDIISIQERHAPNRLVNSVYVKTYQDMGIQDTIEFFDVMNGTPDDYGAITGSGGYIRVFPAVWREIVDMQHNRNDDGNVSLQYIGIEDWVPNTWVSPDYGWEKIDIVRSQGSARYPITKVLGHGYLSDNAGDIILNDYSRTFYTKSELVRFSIVKLKYQTRCHLWKLSAPAGTHIQFRIYDTVFNTYLR